MTGGEANLPGGQRLDKNQISDKRCTDIDRMLALQNVSGQTQMHECDEAEP